MELTRHKITYTQEELVDKLFDSLPNEQDWQYFALMLMNTIKPEELTVDLLIERLESHELEIKKSKINNSAYQQNVELYYRGELPKAGSPRTAFSAESYDWSQVLPEEDAVGYAFVANVDHDLWWRRDYARWEIEKFREPLKEAQRAKRWNNELECYLDPQGNPVVNPPKVDFEAIKEVCEASLPKVVEMNKRKEEELKKLVEEMKIMAKNDVEGEQKIEEKLEEEEKKEEVEKMKKTERLTEIKIENLKSASDEVAGDEKKEELKQTEAAENTNVQITEKDNKFQDFQKEYDNLKWSSQRVQEAYDTLKKQAKSFDERLSATLTTKETYERKFKEKQLELNKYVDEVANLKQVLAEKEKIVLNKAEDCENGSWGSLAQEEVAGPWFG
ncbi:vicilin-like seed storage protein At2g18540 [Helianthus annuus]|uniref:vicilin-like seed storage protein At2g18540 n=1 Tax=Helianthus annuus TaxID=4232 RepID=UPI0016533F80|nr:vicilin-like seed storage protein At2g18540 [Helianthus annuus]